MIPPTSYRIKTVNSLADVNAAAWNRLVPGNHPFLRYEFLAGLEQHECVSEQVGWIPQHFLLLDGQGQLLAAAPAYLKTNSFGEFVFDHSWALAYEQAGLHYYPKLVLAVPFTPVTGKRLLLLPGENASLFSEHLLPAIKDFAQSEKISGIHCLFPDSEDKQLLQESGFMPRMNYQYHWQNRQYHDFEHYLSFFRSRKRKNIHQERRRVQAQGLQMQRLYGSELNDNQWDDVYRFYRSTFLKKGNYPALNRNFFRSLCHGMGDAIMVVLAQEQKRTVAASINFLDHDSLYGRYWGCDKTVDALHFETCFYQGIDFCIQQKLNRFEPGAQGEHKITRGFLPTETWSAHWLREERFRPAVADFLQRETEALRQYRHELDELSPFRNNDVLLDIV